MTQPVEASLFADIAFWVVAFVGVVSAVAVVQTRDILRSALFLILSFLAVAAFFVLLRAEFLAVVQVLIYVGAVSVLIVFAILMTRDVQWGNPSNQLKLPSLALAFLLLGVLFVVVAGTQWITLSEPPSPEIDNVFANSTPWIGRLLIRNFVLPFEAASLLLLAVIVGALMLVKEE